MNVRLSYYVALALLLGAPTYATPPAQPPVSSSESLALASSESTALAGAVSVSEGGDASSGSVSISGGGSGGTSSASGVGVAGSITNAQNSTAAATMGDVSSQSGDSTSSAVAGDSEASASNGDMSTTVNVEGDTYRAVRSAPSVAQGAIVIQTCSAGGNAGGSNTSGSAFLGFAYITGSCYDLSYAAAYAALGQKQAACDILRTSKRGKNYTKRGVTLPAVCSEPAPAVEYATKESVDRMFKRAVSK
jgi:hypothetical protein